MVSRNLIGFLIICILMASKSHQVPCIGIQFGGCLNCTEALGNIPQKCITCLDGYFQSSSLDYTSYPASCKGQCTACIQGCAMCQDAFSCSSCSAGQTKHGDGTCNSCPLGEQYNVSTCQSCQIANCQDCIYDTNLSAEKCVTCQNGFGRGFTGQCDSCQTLLPSVSCDSCNTKVNNQYFCEICTNAGEVFHNGICQACDVTIIGCIACQQEQIAGNLTGNITCTSCAAGQYFDSREKKCTQCSATQYLDKTTSQCTDCTPGLNNCQSCGQQQSWTGSWTLQCFECSQGYVMYPAATSSGYDCIPCSQMIPNCISCSTLVDGCGQSTQTCAQCNTGYSWDSLTKKCALPCQPPLFYDYTEQCSNCNQGDCLVCDFNRDQNNMTYCLIQNITTISNSQCSYGQYYNLSTCEYCNVAIPNCMNCDSSSTCIECAQGYTGNLCVSCSSQIQYCTSCFINQYTKICLICESPKYWDILRKKCIEPCPLSNEYRDKLTGNCLACSIASCGVCDQDSQDILVCLNCDYNLIFSSQKGSCTTCTEVFPLCEYCQLDYQSSKHECSYCSYGYYVDPVSGQCTDCNVTIKNCQSCQYNKAQTYQTYNATNQNFTQVNVSAYLQCFNCLIGYYDKQTQQCLECNSLIPNCVQCYYSDQTAYGFQAQKSCYQCKAGYNLDYQTQTCSNCYYGQFQNSTGKCEDCSKYVSNCQSCSNSTGTVTCSYCFYQYYLESGTCKTCNTTLPNCDSCYLMNNNLTCSQCSSGYVMSGTECLSCSSKVQNCNSCYQAYVYTSTINTTTINTTNTATSSGSGSSDLAGFQCYSCVSPYFYDSVNQVCKNCLDLIPHCSNCYFYNSGMGYSYQYCYQCDEGYTYNFQTQKCSACSFSQYEDSNGNCFECSSAISNCQSCQNNNISSTTSTNFSNSTLGVNQQFPSIYCYYCTYGYTFDQIIGKCVSCSQATAHCQYCYSFNSQYQCQYCESGYVFNSSTNQCDDCSIKIEHCSYCYNGWNYNNGVQQLSCSSCSQGYYFDQLSSQKCQLCTDVIPNCIDCYYYAYTDYYTLKQTAQSQCYQCKRGYNWNPYTKECNKCELQQYMDSKGICTDCQDALPSCKYCGYTDVFTQYFSNFTYSTNTTNITATANTQVKCLECQNGYGIDENRKCVSCISNTHTNCMSCYSNNQIITCLYCFPGYYLFSNSSNSTSTQQTGTINYTGNSTATCVECSTLDANCLECGLQYQQDKNGVYKYLPFCTRCAKGYWWNGASQFCSPCSTDFPSCVDCQISRYFWYDSFNKKFQNYTSFSECYECSDNLFWSPGQRVCSKCQSNEYQDKDQNCLSCDNEASGVPNCAQCNTTFDKVTRTETLQCKGCIVGYAFNNITKNCKSCQELITNCYQCNYTNSTSLKCNLCAYGYYFSDSKCVLCQSFDQNCLSCDLSSQMNANNSTNNATGSTSNTATANKPNTESSSNTGLGEFICKECASGYYFDNLEGKCQACNLVLPNCLSCYILQSSSYNYSFCYVCESPLSWSQSLNKCSPCAFNQYEQNGICVLCSMSSQLSNCDVCGYNQNQALECYKCIAGFTIINGVCSSCGQIQNCANCTMALDNQLYCLDCKDSYIYKSSVNQCQTCDSQLSNCNNCSYSNILSKFTCLDCKDKYYYDNINQQCKSCDSLITNCLSCSYSNDGTTETKFCNYCPIGKLYNNLTQTCSNCGVDEYEPVPGQCLMCVKQVQNCIACQYSAQTVSCVACAPSYTIKQSKCEECPQNCLQCTYSNSNSNFICDTCKYGHFLMKSTGNCVACNTEVDYCSDCHVVNFAFTYKVYCKGCQAGLRLINSSNICSTCLFDEFYSEESQICKKCGDQIDMCYTCDIKTNLDSSLVCLMCQYGYSQNSSLKGSQQKCQSCTYEISNCKNCNYTSYTNKFQCNECQVQYYKNSINQCALCSQSIDFCDICYYQDWGISKGLKCSSCQYGHTLINNLCTDCSEYKYREVGTSNCLDCSSKISNCLTCAQFGDQVQCQTCYEGYIYKASDNTCASCTNAFANCKKCSYDYMSSSLTCSVCAQGYYKDPTTNQCVGCDTKVANCNSCFHRSQLYKYYSYYGGQYAEFFSKINTNAAYEIICLTCSSGKILGSNNNCQSCQFIEYLSSSSVCTSCHSTLTGCQTCTSSAVCTSCFPSFYLSSSSCVLCSSTITGCSQCIAGTPVTCALCEFGKTLIDSTSCSPCKVWEYSSASNTCSSCSSAVTNCRECLYSSPTTACQICYNGYNLKIATGGATTCDDCSSSIPFCQRCQYNQCIQCQEGHAMNWFDRSCSACKSWEYSDSTGQCNTCDKQYCTQCKSDGSCAVCSYQYYLDSFGTCQSCSDIDGCQACSVEPATGKLQCNYCESGKYFDYDLGTCASCDSKQYQCQYCYQSQRQYGMESQFYCYGCAQGSYYDYNSKSCKVCYEYLEGCSTCWFNWNTQAPSCQICNSYDGYILNIDNQKCQLSGQFQCDQNCLNCYLSKDSNGNQVAKCQQCIEAYQVNDDSGSCKKVIYCQPGQFQRGDTCQTCSSVANGGEEGCFQCYSSVANDWFDGFQCYQCANNYIMSYFSMPKFYLDHYSTQYYYYFSNEQICISQTGIKNCPSGCTDCTIEIPFPKCTACDTARHYSLVGSNCVLDCSASGLTNCKYCDLQVESEYVDWVKYPNYWQVPVNQQERNKAYCTICKAGYELTGWPQTCKPAIICNVGETYHQLQRKCVPCPENCLGCLLDIVQSETKTITGTASAYKNVTNSSSSLCQQCVKGYDIQPDGTCAPSLLADVNPCSPGCDECTYNNNIFQWNCTDQKCRPPLTQMKNTETEINYCVPDCSAFSQCSKCWFKDQAQTSLECKACNAGYVLKLSDKSCVQQVLCAATEYYNSESASCAACSQISQCSQCSFDQVLKCYYCDTAGLFTLTEKRTCRRKIPGLNEGPCPIKNFYFDINQNSCQDCPENCQTCSFDANIVTCITCVDGYDTPANIVSQQKAQQSKATASSQSTTNQGSSSQQTQSSTGTSSSSQQGGQIGTSSSNYQQIKQVAVDMSVACIKVQKQECPPGYFKPDADTQCTVCADGCSECIPSSYNKNGQQCLKCFDEYNWYLNSKSICESTFCYEGSSYVQEKGCVYCSSMCLKCQITQTSNTCLQCFDTALYGYTLNSQGVCSFDPNHCNQFTAYVAVTWAYEGAQQGYCQQCHEGCSACSIDQTNYAITCSSCSSSYELNTHGFCQLSGVTIGQYYGYDSSYTLGIHSCSLGVVECYYDFNKWDLTATICEDATFELNSETYACQLKDGANYQCAAGEMFVSTTFKNLCVGCKQGCAECEIDFLTQEESCIKCLTNFIQNPDTLLCTPNTTAITATTCSPGQYFSYDTLTCLDCHEGCATCHQQFYDPWEGYRGVVCDTCSGQIGDYTYQQSYCYKNCQSGEYSMIKPDYTQVCVACQSNCKSCVLLTYLSPPKEYCQECTDDYYPLNFGCKVYPNCDTVTQYLIYQFDETVQEYIPSCVNASSQCLYPVAENIYDLYSNVLCGDCTSDYIYDEINERCLEESEYTRPTCLSNQYYYKLSPTGTQWSTCQNCNIECLTCQQEGQIDPVTSQPVSQCIECAQGYFMSFDANTGDFVCKIEVVCADTNQFILYDPVTYQATCQTCPQTCLTCYLTDQFDDFSLICDTCINNNTIVNGICARILSEKDDPSKICPSTSGLYPIKFKQEKQFKTYVTCGKCSDAGCKTCRLDGTSPVPLCNDCQDGLQLINNKFCSLACGLQEYTDSTGECQPCDLSCQGCNGAGADNCQECRIPDCYKNYSNTTYFTCLQVQVDAPSSKKICSLDVAYFDESFGDCRCFNYIDKQTFYYQGQCYSSKQWIKEQTVKISIGQYATNTSTTALQCADKQCAFCVAPGSANDCISCRVGYYSAAQGCSKCIDLCDVCSDSTSCIRCAKGSFFQSRQCVSSCPSGTYPFTSSAYKFNPNQFTDDQILKGTDNSGTEPPFTAKSDKIVAINKWNKPVFEGDKNLPWTVKDGKIVAKGSKKELTLSCIECTKYCETCADGWFLVDDATKACVITCPDQFVLVSGVCQQQTISNTDPSKLVVQLVWYSMTIDYQAPDYPLQIEGFTNQPETEAISWQWVFENITRIMKNGKDKQMTEAKVTQYQTKFFNGVNTTNAYLEVPSNNLFKGFKYNLTVTAKIVSSGKTTSQNIVIKIPLDYTDVQSLSKLGINPTDFQVLPTKGKGGETNFKASIDFSSNSVILKDVAKYHFTVKIVQQDLSDIIYDLLSTASDTAFTLAPLQQDANVTVVFQVCYNGDTYQSSIMIQNQANPNWNPANSKLLSSALTNPVAQAAAAGYLESIGNQIDTAQCSVVSKDEANAKKEEAGPVNGPFCIVGGDAKQCCGNGECLESTDATSLYRYFCSCKTGFFGEKCNLNQTQADVLKNVQTKITDSMFSQASNGVLPDSTKNTQINSMTSILQNPSTLPDATLSKITQIALNNNNPQTANEQAAKLALNDKILEALTVTAQRRRRFLTATQTAANKQQVYDISRNTVDTTKNAANSVKKGDPAQITTSKSSASTINHVDVSGISNNGRAKISAVGTSISSKVTVSIAPSAFNSNKEAIVPVVATKASTYSKVTGQIFSQDVIDITIQKPKVGTDIPVPQPGIQDAIKFVQNTQAPSGVDPNNVLLKCAYIDHANNVIKTDGMTTNNILVNGTTVTADCSSSHLTSFVIQQVCLTLEGSCVSVCPSTYKVDPVNAKCACKEPCLTCSGTGTAFACQSCTGSNTRDVSNKCKCKIGYFDSNTLSDCQQCNSKCFTCTTSATACSSCIGSNRDLSQGCQCQSGFSEVQGKTDCDNGGLAAIAAALGTSTTTIIIICVVIGSVMIITVTVFFIRRRKLMQADEEAKALQAKQNDTSEDHVLQQTVNQNNTLQF